MINQFYIYIHQKKTDGKCFYVGKGKGNRAYVNTSRNKYWHNVVKKHGFEVVILINNLSEEKAFELEYIICNQIGYKNLVNIREEKGWGGFTHSKETKEKMSQSHKGKKKPWVSECRKGSHRSEETKQKMRKPKTEQHKQNLSNSLKGLLLGRKITWKVGRKKGTKSDYDYSKRIIDYSNMGSKGKELYQYSLNLELIKIWKNTSQASKELGFNRVCIGNVCLKKQKSYKGYIWSHDRL